MGNKVSIPRVKKTTSLDLTKYVNEETGELLTSELQRDKMVVTVTEEGNYVVITSDDYVVLDSKTVNYLSNILSRTEMSNVIMMTTDLKTPFNVIYNGAFPHSNESLQKFLGYSSESTFIKLLQKLMKHGVIYQLKGKIHGSVRVTYLMNPFLARKRKTIDKEIFKVFDSFNRID